jgi:hypothetical protein
MISMHNKSIYPIYLYNTVKTLFFLIGYLESGGAETLDLFLFYQLFTSLMNHVDISKHWFQFEGLLFIELNNDKPIPEIPFKKPKSSIYLFGAFFKYVR